MFTGIIHTLGHIEALQPLGAGIRAKLSHGFIDTDPLEIGESIAVEGICSTVLNPSPTHFEVDYLAETLEKTTADAFQVGALLNLERSVSLHTRMGGHMVSGHVDERGQILSFETDGTWSVLRIRFSPQNRKFLIPKGSICICGISLTIVDLTPDSFSCHLIPHTVAHTSLQAKKPGDWVNLEYDMVGKYLYQFSQVDWAK
jgi:riboflavin synthase